MQSMTGFGSAEYQNDEVKIFVSLKSVNSKNLEIKTSITSELKGEGLEEEIRKIISSKIIRGSLNCNISLSIDPNFKKKEKGKKESGIDLKKWKKEADNVYKKLKKKNKKTVSKKESLMIMLRFPHLIQKENRGKKASIPNNRELIGVINQALEKILDYRKIEGETLQRVIDKNIQQISDGVSEIEDLQEKRKLHIETRLREKIDKWLHTEKLDQDRWEQEVFYYLEKCDISEEIDRLKTHLSLFKETEKQAGCIGKKIIFICQEIGREINTIGSKANFSPIQHLVVQMKDDLEKVREQTANIL